MRSIQHHSLPVLFFSMNYWLARAYATDRGGELLRKTIEDAIAFERLCAMREERLKVINHWEQGSRSQSNHAATKSALEVLKNDDVLNQLHVGVVAAREALATATATGYPVVNAIRADPKWFGGHWETYLEHWSLGMGSGELRCNTCKVLPDRLVGKAEYPQGTDRSYTPTWITTSSDMENIT